MMKKNRLIKKIIRIRAKNRRFLRRNSRKVLNLFSALGIILVLIIMFFTDTIFHVNAPFDNRIVKIAIPEKSSAKDITKILFVNGAIDNIPSFDLSIRMLNLGPHLKAGIYYFKPKMTNLSILSALKEGRLMAGPVKLVVPEGYSIYRIARTLERNSIELIGSFDDFGEKGITDEICEKYPFLLDAKAKTKSLEGYLFPDTYMIFKKISAETLSQLMLNRFEDIVIPIYNLSKIRNKYSLHEILTLASIIEKEAEVDIERPLIASVFYNRLENGMLLRADPTVKYALKNPTKRVYYRDLEVESPYNTYKNTGLPPGPICNPGLKSILAAINPAKTNYLYFVSNGKSGTHTFSSRWQDHERAVSRFRKIDNR